MNAASPELRSSQLRARAAAGELEEIRYPRVTVGALSSNALLAVLGIAFLLPLLWVVFASIDAHAGAGVRIPDPSLTHYRAMAHETRLRPFYNSLYLAGVSTVDRRRSLGLFAAYALSRRHIPFKRTLMLVDPVHERPARDDAARPRLPDVRAALWINSMFWTSMFIAASTLPFTIWLLKNFIDQVPRELEEAAAIEGTSNVQIVLRVVIPLATPGILVTSLVAFINAWGAFVIPLVLDSNPNDVGLDAGTVLSNFFDQRSEFALEHQHAGAGMIENGGKLGGLQAHVERHRDGSNQRRPVIAFQKLMIVEAEIGDAVAGADALGKQPGGKTFATLSELGVGERAGAGDDACLFSVKINGAVQAPDGCKRHVHGQPGKTSAGFQKPRWA